VINVRKNQKVKYKNNLQQIIILKKLLLLITNKIYLNLTIHHLLALLPSIVLQNCLTLEKRLRPCRHIKEHIERRKIIKT
jgi:hypothetical protein